MKSRLAEHSDPDTFHSLNLYLRWLLNLSLFEHHKLPIEKPMVSPISQDSDLISQNIPGNLILHFYNRHPSQRFLQHFQLLHMKLPIMSFALKFRHQIPNLQKKRFQYLLLLKSVAFEHFLPSKFADISHPKASQP